MVILGIIQLGNGKMAKLLKMFIQPTSVVKVNCGCFFISFLWEKKSSTRVIRGKISPSTAENMYRMRKTQVSKSNQLYVFAFVAQRRETEDLAASLSDSFNCQTLAMIPCASCNNCVQFGFVTLFISTEFVTTFKDPNVFNRRLLKYN